MTLTSTVLAILEGQAKRCTKCGEWKGLEGFYSRERGGERVPASQCKTCFLEHCAAYRSDPKVRAAKNAADKARYYSIPREVHREGERQRHRVDLANVVRLEQSRELALAGKRTCRACGVTKPLDKFFPKAGCVGGVLPACRACLLAEQRSKRSGESIEASIAALSHRSSRSKIPKAERDAEHYAKNKTRYAARSKAYRVARPEQYTGYRLSWAETNPEALVESKRRHKSKSVAGLSTPYVLERIRDSLGLPTKGISPELIELKRAQLALTRAVRAADQQLKGTTK